MSEPVIRGGRPQSSRDDHAPWRAAGILLLCAWALWLHRWVPALLVVGFVAWVIFHRRLEAGRGDVLHRRWRLALPWGRLVLIALLSASLLAFVLADGPATAKIVPVALAVLALSMVLFGGWWRLVTLQRWLGGPGSALGFIRTSAAVGPPRESASVFRGPGTSETVGVGNR